MSDYDKWRKSQHPMNRNIGGGKAWGAVSVGDPAETARQQANVEFENPTPIQLPAHLFVPAGSQVIDMRRAANIAAGTSLFEIMSFTCPKGAMAHFLSYAVYSDGSDATLQEFIPRVDGARAFTYQGDPNDSFKINLGLAPDLSNNALIQCQLTLNPGETISWLVTNNNAVEIAMGARMVGYIDRSQKRVNARSGG